MKNLILHITFITTCYSATIACPTGTINALPNGNSQYTFTLIPNYNNTTTTTLNSLKWDFGDGIYSIANPSNLTISHQYQFLTTQTITIAAIYTAETSPGIYCNDTASIQLTIAPSPPTPPCPIAIIKPIPPSDWCNTGTVTIKWDYCNEDYDNNGQPDNFWTADSVNWDMGDGSNYTSMGNTPVTHTFTSPSPSIVTGQAYFTGPNGEQCNAILTYVPWVNDPCNISSTTTNITPYIRIQPYFAQPQLILNVTGACDVITVRFSDSGRIYPLAAPQNNSWTYELKQNGQTIYFGTGLPTQATHFFSTILNPAEDFLFELIYSYVDSHNDTCRVADAVFFSTEYCNNSSCNSCNTFRPEPGKKYWLSAWVKEDTPAQVQSYYNTSVKLSFVGQGNTQIGTIEFYPSGDIVENWQRIIGEFTLPPLTTNLKIALMNDASHDAFFDDIRIHPFNASMKSFVYDPETLWLTAELDDNNYATFYEYDKEGKLIRIKKETARGIMTIQESRSNNPKAQ